MTTPKTVLLPVKRKNKRPLLRSSVRKTRQHVLNRKDWQLKPPKPNVPKKRGSNRSASNKSVSKKRRQSARPKLSVKLKPSAKHSKSAKQKLSARLKQTARQKRKPLAKRPKPNVRPNKSANDKSPSKWLPLKTRSKTPLACPNHKTVSSLRPLRSKSKYTLSPMPVSTKIRTQSPFISQSSKPNTSTRRFTISSKRTEKWSATISTPAPKLWAVGSLMTVSFTIT